METEIQGCLCHCDDMIEHVISVRSPSQQWLTPPRSTGSLFSSSHSDKGNLAKSKKIHHH